jgi:ketosteroid isomerase-like protein
MKFFTAVALILVASFASLAQDHAQQIYDTERAFEKAVAENGIKDAFIRYLSPVGVMFRPGPVNGRAWWYTQLKSPAALTWNPIRIEVSSNGALAYSVGNSIYKPKGPTDTQEYYGHYITVWNRQSDGKYFAALDAGIDHPKPATTEPDWKPGAYATPEPNERQLIASESSVRFYQIAESQGLAKAYKTFAADDIFMMRDGKLPLVGRDAAVKFLADQKLAIKFAKRRSFVEAGDIAYVHSVYTLHDKDRTEKEQGNFVQVWRFRGGKWLIAADLFIVIPPPRS